ncbi:MAG: Coq4 family protein [Myxococcota bacterium]
MRRFREPPLPEMLLALLSPVRPIVGVRAFRSLLNDPHDTAQVFRMIRALSGPHPAWLLWRFRHHPEGARLLRDRPMLLSRLIDRDGLRRLPEGSLGRAYVDFCDAEGITADGLVAASESMDIPLDPTTSDLAYIHHRLRDSHDLWHVLTGYRGDLLGEAALLAFTFAQTGTPGVALVALGGWWELADAPHRPEIKRAFTRGRGAAWLPAVRWETLLDQPLDEVRRELGVGAPPVYTDVRDDPAAVA